MAGVATCRGIGVALHARMVRICRRLRMFVAGNAGEGSVVRRIYVAVSARCPFPGMSSRIDREPCVIECCTQPRGCGVAGSTRCREIRGYVVRICGSRVVRGMAGVTVGRSGRIVAVDVATCACNRDMSPC